MAEHRAALGQGLGGFAPPPPRDPTIGHRIADLRHRREQPEQNFVLCVCGWRQDGEGAAEAFIVHQRKAKAA